jgi:hypothetical protein
VWLSVFSPFSLLSDSNSQIYRYTELAKKSEPDDSFLSLGLTMQCSDAELKLKDREPYKSFMEMKCSEVSGQTAWQPAIPVDTGVAEKIVREFRLHATNFDMMYEGHIQERK